jgi:hypothetical protein
MSDSGDVFEGAFVWDALLQLFAEAFEADSSFGGHIERIELMRDTRDSSNNVDARRF